MRATHTWRFKLRPGVKFHDGTALTAEDVAFSIMRQKNAPLYAALFGGIKRATKVDESTVDVVTKRARSDPAAQDGAPVRHVEGLGGKERCRGGARTSARRAPRPSRCATPTAPGR